MVIPADHRCVRDALSWLISAARRVASTLRMAGSPPDATPTSDPATHREYILLVATSSEEKQLKKAARRLGLSFERKRIDGRGEYFDMGDLARDDGGRAIALRVEMGAHGFTGSASKAIFFQRAFHAQAIICLGMAFGVDRDRQRAGDVLVSVGLLPYDDRIVRCDDDGEHRYDYDRLRMYASKESLVRLFERHRDALKMSDHAVHFGVLLSGSLRVQCATYRDALAKDARSAAGRDGADLPPIIGGEMEGIGLLATSSADNPIWIVVKGISDFADGKEADLFPARRTLACANSAEFVLRALVGDESIVGKSS